MKKVIYIIAFGFFGLIVSTLIHAGIELLALDIIFSNPDTYYNTIWWQQWSLIHGAVSAGLWLGGVVTGVYLGTIWWKPYGSKSGFFNRKRR